MFKKIGFFVLFVWVVGAFVSGAINNYKVKKGCIENEGFVKGWLFCSKESNSSFALEMAKGIFWPALIFSSSSSADSGDINRSEIEKSTVFSMYVCWVSAIKLDNQADADGLSSAIRFMRDNDEKLNRNHAQYLGFASQRVVDIESVGGLDEYYSFACSKPVENVKNAVKQGMFE